MSEFSILCCANYALEVEKVLETLKVKALGMVVMPTECTRCVRHDVEGMRRFLDDKGLKDGTYWILGDAEETSAVKMNYSLCHTALISESLANHWQKSGYYLMTPGWLRRWESLVYGEWGFDRETAPVFLQDAIHKILFLDSGVYESSKERLKDFSDLCQASYEVLPVGLDYLSDQILRVFYAWKMRQAEQLLKAERQKTADYSLAFHLILEQSGIQDMAGVICSIEKIGHLLTAAKTVSYIRIEEFTKAKMQMLDDHRDFEVILTDSDRTFLESAVFNENKNLIVGLMFGDKKLGYLLFENLLFSERAKSYQQLFVNLAPVFAVNLMNAAHFEALEAEKDLVEKANLAKDTFLSVMSHEVRGPLNGVSGALQLIRLGGIRDDQDELLLLAEDALESLLSSINTILDYTKVKSGRQVLEVSRFSIESLINEVYSVFRALSQLKKIDLAVRIDDSARGMVEGDYGKLKQILVNLVGNALKFTEIGTIEVAVRRILLSDDTGASLEFCVSDTGIGIPESKLDTIFEAFEQGDVYTSSRYGGTGLGLSIVKELLSFMGGSIKAQNREAGGSAMIFTVRLHRIEEAL